jgi:hypothetical protein
MRPLSLLMTPPLVVAILLILAPAVMAQNGKSETDGRSESDYYFSRFFLNSVSDKLNLNSQLDPNEERALRIALNRTTCPKRYNLQCKNRCSTIKDAKLRTDCVAQCELVAVPLPITVAAMWLKLLNLGQHTPDDIRGIVAPRFDLAKGNLDCREVPAGHSRLKL